MLTAKLANSGEVGAPAVEMSAAVVLIVGAAGSDISIGLGLYQELAKLIAALKDWSALLLKIDHPELSRP
jgi:hypothetical protein